jgi:GNAT superfamily N-acetyltransferase
MERGEPSGTPGDLPLRPVISAAEIDPLSFADLSNWFDPFLKHFMRETLRAGGEVVVAEDGPRVRGVFLHDPVERAASIFTRSPALANELYRLREKAAVYSEIPLGTAQESIDIFAMDLADRTPPYRFSHPVRALREEDRGPVLALMTSVYGRFNAGWLGSVSDPTEKGYVAEADERPVGVAWVTAVEGHGRLHSLSVLPRYRRLGIGSDLWHARVQWARRNGARRILSEIPEGNAASRAVAERGGMRRVGLAFQCSRP